MNEMQRLISDYFDGQLSEEEGRRLREFIAREPENAREFMRASLLHTCLYEYINGADLREETGTPGDANISPAIMDVANSAPARPAYLALGQRVRSGVGSGVKSGSDRAGRRVEESPRPARFPVLASRRHLAAAAIWVLFGAVSFYFVLNWGRFGTHRERSGTENRGSEVASVESGEAVAILGRTIDAQWGVPAGGPGMTPGQGMAAGAFDLRGKVCR